LDLVFSAEGVSGLNCWQRSLDFRGDIRPIAQNRGNFPKPVTESSPFSSQENKDNHYNENLG
ncbi:hypothetical protein WH95_19780, partial [Kiloniella litopenaei]